MKALDPWTMPLSGTALIEASAGTGKTYTLTTLYVRLLVERRLQPREILVVTYTNAATAELRDRVRSRVLEVIDAGDRASKGEALGDDPESEQRLRDLAEKAAQDPAGDPLLRALSEFDEAAIFTIHGFCQRTLQENAFESGMPFDAELVERSKPIELTLAHDLFRRLIADEDPGMVRWLVDGPGAKWGFEPDALYGKILSQLGADDDMPLLPAREGGDGGDGLSALVAEAAAARRTWAAAWRAGRDEIRELFTDPKRMNQGSYKLSRIDSQFLPYFDGVAQRVEDAGDDDGAVTAVPLPESHFKQFTTAGLAKGANKNQDPVAHRVVADFDVVWAQTAAIEAMRETRVLELRRRFVELAREEAARRRDERHLYFFDDLLSEVRRALRGDGGERLTSLLRERYPIALIDEFQDTDPVQYDVFRRVWHDAPKEAGLGLVLIGDPKQAIYSFRGADVFTYLSAHEDAGEAVYGLERNYRSDPNLIEAVNALFGRPKDPFRVGKIEFSPVGARPDFTPSFDAGRGVGGALRILMLERESIEQATGQSIDVASLLEARFGRTLGVRAVANDLARRLDSGAQVKGEPLAPSDVAILCRKKSEIRLMREALESSGIPCVDRGEADVFESREAWEMSSVLQAMLHPTDPARLRGACSTGAHGADAARIAALSDESTDLAERSEAFAEYGRIWTQSGFGRAFETWRRRERVTERLLAYRDGERRITNWLHLAELLQRYASENRPSRGGLVSALDRAIASSEARSSFGGEASLLRLERDDRAVQLVTLHGCKGLEYPLVYLPFLWEDPDSGGRATGKPPVRFHDEETGERSFDLARSKASVDAAKAETFAEELRLLYVGLTRARHECVIGWGAFKTAPKTPLASLLAGADESGTELKKWSDDEWVAAFETIAATGDASVSVETMDLSERSPWKGEAPEVAALVAPDPPASLPAATRTTSFTGLTREGHAAGTPVAGIDVLGRDLDFAVDVAEEDSALPEAPDLARDLHLFPRGAEAGTLLHSVLELVDFPTVAAQGSEPHREEALRLLAASGMEPGLVDTALGVVDAVATTPLRLEPAPFRLADLGVGALRPEMEFTLGAPGGGFTPSALAAALERAPEGSPLRRYAPAASRLGFTALRGFLRGFIDAVFFDGERYCLADYKSNHLGARQADYLPDALVAPMIDHDYVLQYLLYTVALDRHLATCLPDYDYDRDFGGIYYLFLRGFAPEHAPLCGVFHDRPPRQIVERVSALLGREPEERAA
ncbi:MAG: exodeoxyribonuclease V subunit beta [bacterium]|nr:exodeoxyribonuclease V subunit beta [bacterium]